MSAVTASRPDRGICPVCERSIQLRKDGRLRHHGGPVQMTFLGRRRSFYCDGIGQLPKGSDR